MSSRASPIEAIGVDSGEACDYGLCNSIYMHGQYYCRSNQDPGLTRHTGGLAENKSLPKRNFQEILKFLCYQKFLVLPNISWIINLSNGPYKD